MLEKIKAFFKRPKPEPKGAEKKVAETAGKKEVSGQIQKGGWGALIFSTTYNERLPLSPLVV